MSKHESRVASGKRFLTIVALLVVGYLVGISSREPIVQADVRRPKNEPEHFQDGSEVLLREISAKLGVMDARMARMESLATQFVARNAQEVREGTR